MAKSFLGIEIGGTKLQLVLGDGERIVTRARFQVDPKQGAAGIRQQIQQGIKQLSSDCEPSAVGVGFGGPVEWKSGRICRSHQIEGWSDFELGQWLHGLTGKPVRIDNDANMGSLGEASRG